MLSQLRPISWNGFSLSLTTQRHHSCNIGSYRSQPTKRPASINEFSLHNICDYFRKQYFWPKAKDASEVRKVILARVGGDESPVWARWRHSPLTGQWTSHINSFVRTKRPTLWRTCYKIVFAIPLGWHLLLRQGLRLFLYVTLVTGNTVEGRVTCRHNRHCKKLFKPVKEILIAM